jgi:hypothetical protein
MRHPWYLKLKSGNSSDSDNENRIIEKKQVFMKKIDDFVRNYEEAKGRKPTKRDINSHFEEKGNEIDITILNEWLIAYIV